MGEFSGKILIKNSGSRKKSTKALVDSFLDQNDNNEDADMI